MRKKNATKATSPLMWIRSKQQSMKKIALLLLLIPTLFISRVDPAKTVKAD